jgi:hypothetical protein
MDHSRYLAYRSVQRSLERIPAWLLDEHERERLRDTAEALLLTPDGAEDEAELLRRDAAVALSLLVGQQRWDNARADGIWAEISDCGPRGGAGARRRERAPSLPGVL